MIEKPKLAVIILTHDSYTSKCGSIEFVVTTYLNQDYKDLEIIVLNNSSDDFNTKKLEKFLILYPQVKLINCQKTVGGARNLGAVCSTADWLIFTEDDTIPLQKTIFEKIFQKFKEKSFYAYGAERCWSPPLSWISENREKIIQDLKKSDFSFLMRNTVLPDPQIRNKTKETAKVLLKSFIGNFGIISKKDFKRIGGFPEYPGYACEDDAFAFLCFLELGSPVILDGIRLLHLSHPIKKTGQQEFEKNWERYLQLLNAHGYSAFHITRLLFGNSQHKSILERL